MREFCFLMLFLLVLSLSAKQLGIYQNSCEKAQKGGQTSACAQ